MKTRLELEALSLVLLLFTCGCMNKIPAVARYQDEATRKCLAVGHTKEQCKPATECVHNQYGDCTTETK